MIGLYTSPLFKPQFSGRFVIKFSKNKTIRYNSGTACWKNCCITCVISMIERGKHDIKIKEPQKLAFGLETSVKNIIVKIQLLIYIEALIMILA